jgi:hypothetical protein
MKHSQTSDENHSYPQDDWGDNGHSSGGSQTFHKDMLSAALELGELGYPVFPTKPDKKPSVEGGFYAATTQTRKIRKMWEDGRIDHDPAFATLSKLLYFPLAYERATYQIY